MSKVMTAQSTNPMPRPLWLSVMVDATLVAVALFVYWIRGGPIGLALIAMGFFVGSLVARVVSHGGEPLRA